MERVTNPQSACCARCIKPMGDEQFRVGRYIYGECCILKIEEEQAKKK